MSQTLKPDRPIWPPVPDTIAPPNGEAPDADSVETAAPANFRPSPEAGTGKSGGSEGFGSFSS